MEAKKVKKTKSRIRTTNTEKKRDHCQREESGSLGKMSKEERVMK